MHIRGIKLVPQLLLKHPDTLYTQCRHIGLLHEGVDAIKILFDKMTAFELSHFLCCVLISVLLLLRYYMHGEINLYQSFYWSHLILCIHNVDTLNICMKKIDAIKIFFDKMTAFWTYEGCSGSSWNLVIKCSNVDILHSYFEISRVDIIELAPHS